MIEKINNQNQKHIELTINEIEIDEKDKVYTKNDDSPNNAYEPSQLEASIRVHGIIDPIKVFYCEDTKKFKIIDGKKRVEVARKYNPESKIPSLVINQQPALTRYTLNVIRHNLTVMENAEATKNVQEEFKQSGLPDKEIAKQLGISAQSFSEKIKIANMPETLKSKCRHLKKCSVHGLRKIAGINNPVKQEEALNAYINELYPMQKDQVLQESKEAEANTVIDEKDKEDYQTPQNRETEDPTKEQTTVTPKKSKRNYAQIEKNRIAKFTKSFGRNVEKWKTEEQMQVLQKIKELKYYVNEKEQEIKEYIEESEKIDDIVDNIIETIIDNDAPKQMSEEEIKKQLLDFWDKPITKPNPFTLTMNSKS